jgi:hypothetical protein
MLTLSYRNTIRLLRTFPVCPKPKAIGLANIPADEPTIYVFNHVTTRVEPLFLALAAPPHPPIRFFIDFKVTRPDIFSMTQRDVTNSLFSKKVQEKWGRHALTRKMLEKVSNLLTRFMSANLRGYNVIPVYIHDAPTAEEQAQRRRINRDAFEDCLRSLENHVPVALAPSGGHTHQEATKNVVPTILPSLAEGLQKRGQTLKIVPSVVKERPQVCHGTYKRYIADRILPYRLCRLLLDRLKIKRYLRPRLTVEFLPPVTFTKLESTKEEKVQFVQELQQLIFEVLNRD